MTLDERTLELIHGELDGELDAGGRDELARLAAADPAVRRQWDELRRLQQTLSEVEPLEPPFGLKTAILAGVAGHAATDAGSRRTSGRLFGGLIGSFGWRAGALAAAAMVVVALAWPFVAQLQPVDPAGARGTIGAVAVDTAPVLPQTGEIASAGIVFDGADGHVRVAPLGPPGRWLAEITVDAGRPLQIEIGAGAAELIDAQVVHGDDDALRQGGGRLIWSVAGRGDLRITLSVDETATLELHGIRDDAGIGSARIPFGTR